MAIQDGWGSGLATFLAGIAKVSEEEVGPTCTSTQGLATLHGAGRRRHRSQRATIHHDGTARGFAASQVLAAVSSLIQDLANVSSPI